MKYIALILSFIIFNQATSVCQIIEPLLIVSSQNLTCHKTSDLSIDAKDNDACCKKNMSSDEENEKNECCKDGCNCHCCFKVLVENFSIDKDGLNFVPIFAERVISPVYFHSFDFHLLLIQPPRIS